MHFVLQYIDAIWLPIVFFIAHKDHRRTAVLFVLGCMFLMRMQVELMISIGYPRGILNFSETDVFSRGILIYSLSYIIYIIFLHFSAKSDKSIMLASSLGAFFMVFFLSSVVMLL